MTNFKELMVYGVRRLSSSVFVFIFILGSIALAANSNRIKIDASTASSLLIVLKGSESFHTNLVDTVTKKDTKKIKQDAAQLSQLVKVALRTAREKEPAENLMHLEKILLSADGRLQDFINVAEGETTRRLHYLREFFKQIIQIASKYAVPHNFNIFFCPKDKQKGVWIQKSTKAQNPFDSDGTLKNCGAIVK